jgi:hypothetical protein
VRNRIYGRTHLGISAVNEVVRLGVVTPVTDGDDDDDIGDAVGAGDCSSSST